MILNKLNILNLIHTNQVPSKETLNTYLSILDNPFIVVPNLFFDANLKVQNVNIEEYINSFLSNCNFYSRYNSSEKAWYRFYVLLRGYREPKFNLENIYNQYNSLPHLQTSKEEIEWIAYQIKVLMLAYYIQLNKDIKQLLQEINNIPLNIKQLSY